MAKKAQAEAQESVELAAPDFTRAIKIMKNDIAPQLEDSAGIRGDLSAAWKTIEDDCHVNRKAAKDFNKLNGMSEENRDDYLRSLYGLMKAGNIGISQDLVDRMDGKGDAPKMPTVAVRGGGLATLN
jgi:hypothetical protein